MSRAATWRSITAGRRANTAGWLLGLLVQLALSASFPLDPASARITEQEELIAPASPAELEAVRIAGCRFRNLDSCVSMV
jgi:hypothetical protein